jgi:hypothetical protein
MGLLNTIDDLTPVGELIVFIKKEPVAVVNYHRSSAAAYEPVGVIG